jgi:SAM-dependent methyltransferase
MSSEEWFETWFDLPFNHLLYRERDQGEARSFLENLINKLNIDKGATLLDLACGSGRHSLVLHEMGFDVTGLDLSPYSIEKARARAKDVSFYTGDMRSFQIEQKFDVVLNLFTSFGYFSDSSDNLQVLGRVRDHLKPSGRLIIDYLNIYKVKDTLVPRESRLIEGVTFEINRYIENNFIFKEIAVDNQGVKQIFQERVQGFDENDIRKMLRAEGFGKIQSFGNYRMDPFDTNSDRLILVASF